MKLSKNRLHKIKGKKNSSRKKNNFRKRKGKKSYENTKKRHKRTHNLRKKTLKIYVGGDETEQEKKERLKILDKKNNTILSKLKMDCKSLPPLPSINATNNTTISTYIHTNYPLTEIINQPVLKEYGKSKLYRIETSNQGNCLYDSVVFGLLYARVGKWNNLTGWIPQQDINLLEGGSFVGNLRLVLRHYICDNSESILEEGIMSTNQLLEAFTRLGNSFDNKPGSDGSGYGESEEIQLLARMFNVCIFVYSLEKGMGTQMYNNKGASITKVEKCKKENTISIVHVNGDHFQNVLAIANPSTTQQKTRTRKLQQKTNRTPAEEDELQQEAAAAENTTKRKNRLARANESLAKENTADAATATATAAAPLKSVLKSCTSSDECDNGVCKDDKCVKYMGCTDDKQCPIDFPKCKDGICVDVKPISDENSQYLTPSKPKPFSKKMIGTTEHQPNPYKRPPDSPKSSNINTARKSGISG